MRYLQICISTYLNFVSLLLIIAIQCSVNVEKVSNLDATLDSEYANTLEDLLTKAGANLPGPSEEYTTADSQGMYLVCRHVTMLPSEEH